MNLGLRNSIGVRLLRIVFGCYLVITLLVTAIQLYFEYSNVEKGVVSELYNVGRSFEDGLSAALWSLDNEAVKSILDGVKKIEAVSGVKVTNQDGDLESYVGIVSLDVTMDSVRQIQVTDILANEIYIYDGQGDGMFYEYRREIIFKEFEDSEPEVIGYVYIYATRDIVVSRFKNSLFLILVNALIKSFALWVIFIYFSRRILSKPLADLTHATSALGMGDTQSVELSSRLVDIADSHNKSELQQLAERFLFMRRSISEKIENLNALNGFAISLARISKQELVFQKTFDLLASLFGVEQGQVVNRENTVVWRFSTNGNSSGDSLRETQTGSDYLDTIRVEKEINYCRNEGETSIASDDERPMLYIPVAFGDNDCVELWLFGEVEQGRLEQDGKLSVESLSFLQVVANIMGAALTSIAQGEIIQDQNKNLEDRVIRRTHELAAVNEELRHLAVHDPLTQLPNRTLFNDRLQHAISAASRKSHRFAVVSIDLSKFKQTNDTYGHDSGDAVLVEVSRRFNDTLRKSDTLARMGGDEFAAILSEDNNQSTYNVVIERLLECLSEAIYLDNGESVFVGANIGIAIFPDHASEADVLYKFADIAMYQAKRSGKGYALFDKEKNAEEIDQLQLMYELEHAIEENQLSLYYQPVIDLKSGVPVGAEALLRWIHPVKGIVPPGMFIPHAERTTLIKPITLWVVEEACRQCASWHAQGMALAVSVNLSARIFSLPELPLLLRDILAKTGLDPKWLKLEITESAAMTNPEKALSIITSFCEMGMTISIDDFGTGYSSLSYLTRLPVDELKIDRSFLLNMDENSLVVVETVIELAHNLDFYVVAEGIEDLETLDMLIEKGCDAVQGYYLRRPCDPAAFNEWYQSCELKKQFWC